MSAGERLERLRELAYRMAGIGIIAAAVAGLFLAIVYVARVMRPEPPPPAIDMAAPPARAARVPQITAQGIRFDALARSESAQDRLEAYRLAQRCMLEAELEGMDNIDYQRTCDLPRHRWSDRELRRQLIEPAALQGLPGAWRALYEEGPQGRFKTMAEHPGFGELEQRAYAAALAKADRRALAHEADRQEAQGNLARALTYTVASAASLARQQRRERSYDPELDPHLDLTHYRSRLEPDVVQSAIAEGLRMVSETM